MKNETEQFLYLMASVLLLIISIVILIVSIALLSTGYIVVSIALVIYVSYKFAQIIKDLKQ